MWLQRICSMAWLTPVMVVLVRDRVELGGLVDYCYSTYQWPHVDKDSAY